MMYQPYPPQKKGTNHALHLIVTVCTCGVWLPFWIVIAAINGGKKRWWKTKTTAFPLLPHVSVLLLWWWSFWPPLCS